MEAGREIEKIGSVGRALAHVEIRICDSEGARCRPTPKVNFVSVVQGHQGYWNDPVKTAESFHGDWLRSEDVGYLDDEGFLYLTDRVKDMILTGAENVASSEVEAVLYKLPQIVEAAAIGVPDAQWGEPGGGGGRPEAG